MKLYKHFLFGAHDNRQPSRLLALECDSVREALPGKPIRERETLSLWYGAGWSYTKKSGYREWEGFGLSAESAWQGVLWGLDRPGRTWIVSWGAARVWGLLDLWRRIEDGEVRISGEGRGHKDGNAGMRGVPDVPEGSAVPGDQTERTGNAGVRGVQTGRRHGRSSPLHRNTARCSTDGLIVLEDPPCMILARWQGHEGELCIVDARNYGLKDYPTNAPAHERAHWLRGAMRRMVDTLVRNQWGALQMSAAAQASHTHRSAYLTHTIHCHARPATLALEERGLYGGRCEPFRLGKIEGPVYHLDFRNQYPSVCLSERLPAMLSRGAYVPSCTSAALAHGQGECLAEVAVETDEPAYPYRTGDEVIYPVGRFRTVLCGPELVDALEHDSVRKVYKVARYVLTPCLRAFVEGVYPVLEQARADQDTALAAWLKTVLVCLPGKFAQRGGEWQSREVISPFGPWRQWWEFNREGAAVRARSIGWQVQVEAPERWGAHAAPAIAAWVTSHARVKLMQVIRCAGWENVYYVDTDSLLVSRTGYDRLQGRGEVQANSLGRLRLLGMSNTADVRGVKHYLLDGEWKCSGMPKGTVEPTGDGQTFWFRDQLRAQARGGEPPRVERVLRRFVRRVGTRSGVVGEDGRVSPYQLEEPL